MDFPYSQNGKRYLLLFIHGFIGGKETWIREDGQKSLLNYLEEDRQLREYFDVALYTYDTSIFNSWLTLKNIVGLFKRIKRRHTKNWNIETIAAELGSQIRVTAKNYEKIVVIAHSMGGLISKKFILEELKDPKFKIGLYVSIGKFIAKNKQVENLSAINKFLSTTNQSWIRSTGLPKRVYFRGFNDQVVNENASIAIEVEKQEIINSPDDHFSILVPTPESSHVVNAIKDACIDFLRENGAPIEASEPIKVQKQERVSPPPRTRWGWIVAIVAIAILLGYLFLKPIKPNQCPMCSIIDTAGLIAFYFEKNPDKNYNVFDYRNQDTLKHLSNPDFEKFLSSYIGEPKLISDVDKIIELDTLKSGNFKVLLLKFKLPKDRISWAGFGVGFKKQFYDNFPGSDFENKDNWAVDPDHTEGRVRFVFMDSLATKEPTFKLIK
jgi:hypothetical protein